MPPCKYRDNTCQAWAYHPRPIKQGEKCIWKILYKPESTYQRKNAHIYLMMKTSKEVFEIVFKKKKNLEIQGFETISF